MITKAVEKVLGDGVRVLDQPGVDLGNGNIKTAMGTIRVPDSEHRKKYAVEKEPVKEEHKEPAKPDKTVYTETVTVHSEIGLLQVPCKEVNVCDGFLVLGLVDPATFKPRSYKEDPDVRLSISYKDKTGSYVYTGCTWRQLRTNTTFVVLMEVK